MTSPRGTMILSLDLELCWGQFDLLPVPTLEAISSEERPQIKRLLRLLDQYEIPATWAVVGHLMLEGCSRHNSEAHPEVAPHAEYSWFPQDWYVHDPCISAAESPGWYAPDIVEWIREARVPHELASHSFAHIYYGDRECSAAAARADLTAAVAAAAAKDIVLKSFVFPRNQVGHLNVLREEGIRTYRGVGPSPFGKDKGVLGRTLRFLDQLLGLPPMSIRAEEAMPGLWNIPGNHFFIARDGIRKLIPAASRVLKAKRGIRQAMRSGGLYHLWFHPFNLNADPDTMFAGLEEILSYAAHMRATDRLDILTMGEYGRRLEAEQAHATSEAAAA
jgi:peptidoglycan/xylan/chitin deacetylase (PgdA/CDA1 family)